MEPIEFPDVSELALIREVVRRAAHCGVCDWDDETGEVMLRFVAWCDEYIIGVQDE